MAITLLCCRGVSWFSYTLFLPAEVSDVQPRYGSIAGGTLLTVYGSGFVSDFYSGSASVFVGEIPCIMNWYGIPRGTDGLHGALLRLNEVQC